MKDYNSEYQKKVISIEEAVHKMESDMDVVVAMGASEPQGLLQKFHTVADKVKNVKVFAAVMLNAYDFIINPEMKGHLELCSWFHSNAARVALNSKAIPVSYVPNVLRRIALDRPYYKKTPKN